MITLRLTILVYDWDEQMRAKLRQTLTYFAIHHDVDLRIDWIFRQDQENQIPALISDTLVALVNADIGERAAIAGQQIYNCNPDCLLVYYGTKQVNLMTLLSARPTAYQPQPECSDKWEQLLLKLCKSICDQNSYLRWTNKNRQYCIPCRAITYIQSERSYLTLYTDSNSSYKFIGKLDEVEKQLPGVLFLRIHKSTLVNLDFAQILDKTHRCLILQNGSELNISRAHYRQVLMKFEPSSAGAQKLSDSCFD